ncbi:MAG TPA: hypothetical protein PK637_10940 [Flavobacteriales bacterium]|nr:hypothetical protein [Flavobacteriales bacterium]HRE76018.1 hypothetical protein [Flavobacteriales bacterium]HRE97273.1 hypothetical protein [Flavobacteriales bacterium]HRJ34722.1 hypothetical protein [Flavobacteriales bacterium]HRJ39298.1 hypothetical protein [Flavobacteriales bacterium]
MTDYLKEYQEYYRVRMQRYENDPEYTDSYQSEKAIYEAIAGVNEMEGFRERLGNLNELNAVAYTRDKQRMYLRHFESMQETVRAQTPKRIMDKAPSYEKVMDLIEMINNEEAKGMLEITADSVSPFDNWILLEYIELYSKADVPEQYKSTYKKYIDDYTKDQRERLAHSEGEIGKFVPGWKFKKDLPTEFRHRRKFPVNDAAFEARLKQFIQINNL